VPCDAMREAGLQLLDALERLEALDRGMHPSGETRGKRRSTVRW